jgi:hypothetical protein
MKTCLAAFAAAVLLVSFATFARAGTLPDISGTWYSGGDHFKRCRIEQSGTSLSLRNEDGQTASGDFVNPSEIATRWRVLGGSTYITGRISGDLQTIRWSNGTFWTRAGGMPEPTATPNPYREIQLVSPTLENRSQGKIALLGGWAAVKRDGRGAVVCVSFKNEAAETATRVVFQFALRNRAGMTIDELQLDRQGTFSPGTDINGWDSLSQWQGGVGHRGYGDNCKVIGSGVAAQSLISAHSVTYTVTRVEYADGRSWTP